MAALATLAVAPAAHAAFGLANLSATPANTAAGANSNLTISLDVTEPSHDLKDLTIHLPPGLVGNPLATPTCSEADLANNACDPVSQVGTVSNDVTINVLSVIPVNQTVSGKIYNVTPRTGEPARFGIVLSASPVPLPAPLNMYALPPIIAQSPASLRQSDFGLDTVLNDLPNQATLLQLGILAPVQADIDINSISLTLNGMAGSPPKGFIRNPTSCKTHTVGFDATSYDAQTASGQATFTTDSCGALPFTPELAAKVKQGKQTDAVELTTTISQTIEEAGLQRAQVTLPKDLFGSATVLATSCPDPQFQAGTCPANTIVGNAVATSPLLSQPLSGPVALVAPSTPGLPDLGVDLRGPLALKLKGTIGITPEVRNQVVFDGLPDIPIANFALTFAGGPTGLTFATRDLCQPPDVIFDAAFLAHSGATANVSPKATVECSGGGGGGSSKKPRAKIKLGRLGSDAPTMRLKVRAGSEKLRSAKLTLPRQLEFAGGSEFKRGSSVKAGSAPLSGKALKHSKRALKLTAKRPTGSFKGKFADGALRAGKGLHSAKKLRFKLRVRDVSGKTTKLTVRAK